MKKIILFCVALVCLLTASSQSAFMSVEGERQGKFKAESTKRNHTHQVELSGYVQEIITPRDAASGMPTGKRMHQPLVVLKSVGAASPQFMSAQISNENLKSVKIEFFRIDPASRTEVLDYTVTLQNARVVGVRQFMGSLIQTKFSVESKISAALYDEITFTYEKITVESNSGKTMANDTVGSGY